jgi:peptidoglycan glycosyltransferase
MNKPIRTVAIFCLLLFLALALNATYLQYYHASALNDRVGNGRVATATFSRDRGAILVGGQPIAQSVESTDQYKYQRVYKQPFMYAPITGWYTFGNETGIERQDNNFLSGEDDRLFVNRLVDLVNGNASKGGNVVLTINPAAQKAAYDGLKALGPGVQGSVVAIDPSTGKILAMVSLPTYDPNKLATHDFKAASAYATQLSKAPGDPLLNRAVQTTLPPGSTFKIVTASAAIQSGRFTSSSLVPGGPSYRLPQSSNVVHNEIQNCGSGRIPFLQAMEFSCNTSFAPLAVAAGATAMHGTAEGFGFNQSYLQDLPGQAVSRYPAGMDDAQTALSGFGQGSVTATPLQMAMVSAGIANHGVVMRPYLTDELQSPSQEPLVPGHSKELSQAVSRTTASEVTKLMVAVVQHGTATPAAIPGVTVAGKTGTAQSGLTNPDGSEVPPYAWFTSFAPASTTPDGPAAKVAVAVMIQHINRPTSEIAGGALGGPIAKAVMEAVLRSHG